MNQQITWEVKRDNAGKFSVIGTHRAGAREVHQFSTLEFATMCKRSLENLTPGITRSRCYITTGWPSEQILGSYVSAGVTPDWVAEQMKLSNIILRSVGLSRAELKAAWNILMWGERGRSDAIAKHGGAA